MAGFLLQRRLRKVSTELLRAREELRVVSEQHLYLASDADDSAVDAALAGHLLAGHEHRQDRRHADVLERRRTALVSRIAELEARQDDLLDRLGPGR